MTGAQANQQLESLGLTATVEKTKPHGHRYLVERIADGAYVTGGWTLGSAKRALEIALERATSGSTKGADEA